MCPLWYKALSSKCNCGKEEIKYLLDHNTTCEYRIHYWNLLEASPDLEDHYFYSDMYKSMMYKQLEE